MYEIKKLQISSVAKISGIASGLWGLVAMAIGLLSILPSFGTSISDEPVSVSYGRNFEIIPSLFILAIPLLTALIGYIYGAVMAWLYNLIVPYVGGVKMEIELIEENKQQ